MSSTDGMTLTQIRQAVARGWCSTENGHKVMDSDLAFAISNEVFALLAATSTMPASGAAVKEEPVGEVLIGDMTAILYDPLPVGTKLYAPQPTTAEVPNTAPMYKALMFAKTALLAVQSGASIKAVSLIDEVLCAVPTAEPGQPSSAVPLSYHDVVVSFGGQRHRLFDVSYGLQLQCTRVAGWELWNRWGGVNELLAGEFHTVPLTIEVGEFKILNGSTPNLDQPSEDIRATAPLETDRQMLLDLFAQLGVQGHAGATAEITKLRQAAGLDAK